MTQLSMHFNSSEFTCRCCGQLHPSGGAPPQALIDFLENIRAHFGDRAVHINSGYRCPKHNAAVGGASASKHMQGTATDFWIHGVSPKDVYGYADELIGNAGGVGMYDTFTHIDVRGKKARW